ncbi:MAG TPA: DUF3881 family protein [Candidatus Blautia avistercoris]|uniref:DUF3881 family protein n=1 Tax=Candidatus Eisenbergiella merdipullorum TaxID=2838553 RepID=A0A9D2I8B8_9FIRM|nr:DUF3881 family protein [Lachnoclostridium sp. An138]OUQ16726.1 hypothetical protein B5E82_12605 [Lachnoclostridium sp. An138]HIY19197.1 DUF3881 family protein [Candidatus Blautia avistercoris]HJA94616.1 DUF3881 family protein [Candidatus Eisenbergiella merdipullorum]
MHEYLRAVGFSSIENKEQLKHLLEMTEDSYQSEKTAFSGNGNDFSERKKEFAPRMGIILRGEYDEKGDYQRDYYFPYFEGTQEKFYDNISIERHAEKESYAGVCEDLSMGVTIIFYVQNIVDYLSERHLNHLSSCTARIRFSGLSIDGRILLPVAKRMTEEENSEAILQRTRLLKAAREGDEEAIENLTLEDMDTYSMISRRIADEDVFSIVSTYFMPYGVECDHYNVLGEILNIEMVENSLTRERVYILTIESHDLIFEVCINQKDLLGEPAVGRRFKGIVWLQGNVSFQN